MSRTSRCLRSSCVKVATNTQNLAQCKPKCLAQTLLILLGVLAQMTGEADSSKAAKSVAQGHHYQVQRVMSMHNNSSSTLPFIPSSTSSILTAQPVGLSAEISQPVQQAVQLVSVPIRHWWMAVYHHHGDQHSSRVKRLLQNPALNPALNQPNCINEELYHQHANNSFLSVKGEPEWEDRVCATRTLDERVRVLLEALPCPHHRVCQILSPELLRRLARPDQCRNVARNLWRNLFHKLYLMIRDFSDVLQQKFDIGDYSTMHQNQRCKEAYTFWICSIHLPMWLLNPDNNKSEQVEACKSTCLTVEKRCPFLIKGTEDDMASGNPSFMCKDASVPVATSSTLCCYTSVMEPRPGQYVNINVSQGFCHEPDHVQLHLAGNTTTKVSGGWSANSKNSSSLPLPSKKTQIPSSSNFHQKSSCDKLLWPSASLNVTSSEEPIKLVKLKNQTSYEVAEALKNDQDTVLLALVRWLQTYFESESESFTSGAKGVQSWTTAAKMAILQLVLALQLQHYR